MKIIYTNFKKEFSIISGDFQRWFYFGRTWKGKVIYIGIKHHQITIDLRGDLFEEMTGKKAP